MSTEDPEKKSNITAAHGESEGISRKVAQESDSSGVLKMEGNGHNPPLAQEPDTSGVPPQVIGAFSPVSEKTEKATTDEAGLDRTDPNKDLSADKSQLNSKVEQPDSWALRSTVHRENLQQNVFSCAVSLVAFLYISAIVFVGCVLYLSATTPKDINWHFSLLAGALIIPPTVILLVLIRSIYVNASQKNEEKDKVKDVTIGDLPALSMIKELIALSKDVVALGKKGGKSGD